MLFLNAQYMAPVFKALFKYLNVWNFVLARFFKKLIFNFL